jgi:hypothetical protein
MEQQTWNAIRSGYYRLQRRQQREASAYRAAKLALIALLIGLLLIALVIPAHAETSAMDEKTQTILALAAFAAIDYNQSCDMFYSRQGYYEINPVLGKHPSRRGMLVFGTAGIGLLWGGAEILERAGYPRAARVLVDSALSSEQWNIEDNVLVADGKHRRIDAIPIVLTWRW